MLTHSILPLFLASALSVPHTHNPPTKKLDSYYAATADMISERKLRYTLRELKKNNENISITFQDISEFIPSTLVKLRTRLLEIENNTNIKRSDKQNIDLMHRVIKHVKNFRKNKTKNNSFCNKVFTLSISGIPHGYLIMKDSSYRFNISSCYIAAVFRDPDSMINRKDIKHVSQALLAKAINYFLEMAVKRTVKTQDTHPILLINPIHELILRNIQQFGFILGPNCTCGRRKCTKRAYCYTTTIDYWNPNKASWCDWLTTNLFYGRAILPLGKASSFNNLRNSGYSSYFP